MPRRLFTALVLPAAFVLLATSCVRDYGASHDFKGESVMSGSASYELAKPIILKIKLHSPSETERAEHFEEFLERFAAELEGVDFLDIELVGTARASTFAVSVRILNTDDKAVFHGWVALPDLMSRGQAQNTVRFTFTHANLFSIPMSQDYHDVLENAGTNAGAAFREAAVKVSIPNVVTVL